MSYLLSSALQMRPRQQAALSGNSLMDTKSSQYALSICGEAESAATLHALGAARPTRPSAAPPGWGRRAFPCANAPATKTTGLPASILSTYSASARTKKPKRRCAATVAHAAARSAGGQAGSRTLHAHHRGRAVRQPHPPGVDRQVFCDRLFDYPQQLFGSVGRADAELLQQLHCGGGRGGGGGGWWRRRRLRARCMREAGQRGRGSAAGAAAHP